MALIGSFLPLADDGLVFYFMYRDYKKWHILKSSIEKSYKQQLFKEREIWWCSLGANVGFEQDGKNDNFEKPVLVLRKFNSSMFWGLPLTSQPKKGRYYFSFYFKDREITIILSQLRILSFKRMIRRVGKVNVTKFNDISCRFKDLLN
ncbi:MAG: hypothetical protein COU22_01245 [Candidatus Komeilibacteria bacterium CG10_big_fil_rev_8_21_14_0_10_41_13]|uniref:Toxin-antitoxin system protein n=1 Tax=Candidatus Komeilibacteria bacterium CG10_big_fil_rev_8_21_14_0_10_41_13 TaxID=1974476 RepID=A0A2M6WCV2_9BACT|nr:MAG: hypothetical protein COU22_01245 [Candidatus Komeilibacteria bacterium CG10_big_fil_rev_8_21_14_0_10_41_13]